MDIDKLQIFLKVAQYGSFKRVAEEEFRTQRAISKQMKQLEIELGVTLFVRRANRIALTKQGQFFRSAAQDIVNNYTKALSELAEYNDEVQQNLQVGYFSAFEQRLLKSALYALKIDQPDLHLNIREESNEHLMQSIKIGNLDAALSIEYGNQHLDLDSSISSETIFTGEMVMGVSTLNALSKQDYLLPEDLKNDQPILYYSPESSTFLMESFLSSMTFITDLERIQRVTSVEQMQLLVSLNQALAFYPSGLLNSELMTADSHIKLMPIRHSQQQYQIVVLYRTDNENPALKSFLQKIIPVK
jgi:DNA-binding transcriptional LysR family regulator